MIDKVQLCVTLIILARGAHERKDEKACEVYGETMKSFIRKLGITVKDCDMAMRIVQNAYYARPVVQPQEVDCVA